jgi:hypothetical protein
VLEIEIPGSEQSIRKSIKMDAYINIPEDREFPESDRVYVQLHGACLLIAWCYLAPIAAALAVLLKVHGVKEATECGDDADQAHVALTDTYMKGRLNKKGVPGAAKREQMMLAHKGLNTLVLVLSVVGCVPLWWVRSSREAEGQRWGNGHAATYPHAMIFGRLIMLLAFLQPVWFFVFNKLRVAAADDATSGGKPAVPQNLHAIMGYVLMGLAYWNSFWGAANWQVGWGKAAAKESGNPLMEYGYYLNYFVGLTVGVAAITYSNKVRKAVRATLSMSDGAGADAKPNKGEVVGKDDTTL